MTDQETIDVLWTARSRLTVGAAELTALGAEASGWTGGKEREPRLVELGRALREAVEDLRAVQLAGADAQEELLQAADALARQDVGWPQRNRVQRTRLEAASMAVDRVLSAVDEALVQRGEVPNEPGDGSRGRLTSNSRSNYSSVRTAG